MPVQNVEPQTDEHAWDDLGHVGADLRRLASFDIV